MSASVPRTFIEQIENPNHYVHNQPGSLFARNSEIWDRALISLGLVVPTYFPAQNKEGERIPYLKAKLYDKELVDANQFTNLSIASRDSLEGIGPHINPGLSIVSDIIPREIKMPDVLEDISKVTLGGVQRHPDIEPSSFEPLIEVCREIGTISLLNQFTDLA